MSRDDAKRAFDEAILERFVALNAARAAEEARDLVRWLRSELQNPQSQQVPQQSSLATASPIEWTAPKPNPTAAAKPLP